MATRATRTRTRAAARHDGFGDKVERVRRSVMQRASHVSGKQWAAIAIAGGVIGGAVVLMARPRLAKSIVKSGLWLVSLPAAGPVLTKAYDRAKDALAGTVPLLEKASPRALFG